MYTNGGQDTGLQNGAIGANIGGSYRGLSVDFNYANERGATTAASGPAGTTQLAGTAFDSEMWSIMGKYTMELGGGGYKDDAPGAKLTFYAGYEHVDLNNPQDQVGIGAAGAATGATTVGGYSFASVNNTAFMTTREQQIAWTGAKYETGPWAFTAAYYHQTQNSWTNDNAGTCAANTRYHHEAKRRANSLETQPPATALAISIKCLSSPTTPLTSTSTFMLV